jgi:hypothetical protein
MADTLLDLIVANLEHGQRDLALHVREAVRILRPDLHPLVERLDDRALRHPFACLHVSTTGRGAGLERIFAGDIAASGCAVSCDAPTDDRGRFYVPRLGWFTTGVACGIVTLTVEGTTVSVEHDGRPVAWTLEPPSHIRPFDSFEICRWGLPALEPCFEGAGTVALPTIEPAVAAHHAEVAEAVSLIERCWPQLAVALSRAVSMVVLFDLDTVNSFAAPLAQGAVFLNAALGPGHVFFAEDLAHQGGHVVFAAATIDPASYFTQAPGTLMREVGGHPDDTRSAYVVLHGVVTETLMAHVLELAIDGGELDRSRRHEAEGRLAFILHRLAADITNLGRFHPFTDRGDALVSAAAAFCRAALGRHRALLERADLSGQGYNFRYHTFLERNPYAHGDRPADSGPSDRRIRSVLEA